jgi:hydrogenase maturation protease
VRIHVIGVGTTHGDDAAGLAVLDALATDTPPPGLSLHRCARPIPDLLDALADADAAIVVDAARTGAAPGSVRRLARADLDRSPAGSSHGLGVAQALALADALGAVPARLELVAIEIGEPGHGGLGAATRAGVAEAARQVLRIAREIEGFGLGSSSDA